MLTVSQKQDSVSYFEEFVNCWGVEGKIGSVGDGEEGYDLIFEEGSEWGCVVWYGVVWCGMVWRGMVWYGMVWCGVVWCGKVWYGMVWRGVVWYSMVWYRMMVVDDG